MLLLRNLVYNSQSDIQAVLHWSSNALLAAVRDALQRSAGQTAVRAVQSCSESCSERVLQRKSCWIHGSACVA
jgi:hypothetical protein